MDWLSFFIGVLVGWIAEWLIDFFYWRRKYLACEQEKEALRARLDEAERRILTFQVKGRAPESESQREPSPYVDTRTTVAVPPEPEDLKVLEGIGPKIAQLLKDDGILTFAQLADTSVERLEAILHAAGPNFRLADPATWPEQARLAADGKWDALRVLQDRLIGGQNRRHGDL